MNIFFFDGQWYRLSCKECSTVCTWHICSCVTQLLQYPDRLCVERNLWSLIVVCVSRAAASCAS